MLEDTDLPHQGVHQDYPVTKDLESADRLIALVDSEIERIDREEAQSGWTKWALYVGLATLFALLLADLEKDSLDLQAVGMVLLALFVAHDWLVILSMLIDEPTPSPATRRFRLTQQIYGPRRSAMLLALGRYTVLIVLAFHLQPFIAAPYTAFLLFFLGSLAVTLLANIVLSAHWFPVAQQYLPLGAKILLLVILVCGAVGVFGIVQSLVTESITVTIADIRSGAILWAAAVLIGVLAQGQLTNPLRASLLTIRRRLALQELRPDAASQQIDIALQGMTADQLLQHHIAEILSDWEKINRRYRSLAAELDEISTFISTFLDIDDFRVTADTQTRRDEVHALFKKADQISESIPGLVDRLDKRMQKLDRRASLLTRVFPPSASQIRQIYRTIRTGADVLAPHQTAVRDRLDELRRQMDVTETHARLPGPEQ